VAAGHRHRIAPFMSILQDFEAWERFDNIKLVYSVREAKELAYVEEIAGLEQRDYLAEFAGKLQFIPVVTRETHPGALNARITTLIENGELERAAGLELSTEHSRIMLCGNPEMIDETRKVLKARDLQLSLSKRPGQGGGELLVAARFKLRKWEAARVGPHRLQLAACSSISDSAP
jgi:ferredoxin--NADP+ reductase